MSFLARTTISICDGLFFLLYSYYQFFEVKHTFFLNVLFLHHQSKITYLMVIYSLSGVHTASYCNV